MEDVRDIGGTDGRKCKLEEYYKSTTFNSISHVDPINYFLKYYISTEIDMFNIMLLQMNVI